MLRSTYSALGAAGRRAANVTLAPFEQLTGKVLSTTTSRPVAFEEVVSSTAKAFSSACRRTFGEGCVKRSVPIGLGILLAAETSQALRFPVAMCDSESDNTSKCGAGETGAVKKEKEGDDDNQLADQIVEQLSKVGFKLGFTGCLGVCAGYTVKQLGKSVALLVGAIFSLLQLLAYNGLIEIKWEKLKSYLESLVDFDKDGNFSPSDLKILVLGGLRLMKHNLPNAAGFGPGFYLGFTRG